MKKVFARLVNVIAVISFVYGAIGIYWYFVEHNAESVGFSVFLIVLVLVVNYIFFGKATIWNELDEME